MNGPVFSADRACCSAASSGEGCTSPRQAASASTGAVCSMRARRSGVRRWRLPTQSCGQSVAAASPSGATIMRPLSAILPLIGQEAAGFQNACWLAGSRSRQPLELRARTPALPVFDDPAAAVRRYSVVSAPERRHGYGGLVLWRPHRRNPKTGVRAGHRRHCRRSFPLDGVVLDALRVAPFQGRLLYRVRPQAYHRLQLPCRWRPAGRGVVGRQR
jgi:hypothetical protein